MTLTVVVSGEWKSQMEWAQERKAKEGWGEQTQTIPSKMLALKQRFSRWGAPQGGVARRPASVLPWTLLGIHFLGPHIAGSEIPVLGLP